MNITEETVKAGAVKLCEARVDRWHEDRTDDYPCAECSTAALAVILTAAPLIAVQALREDPPAEKLLCVGGPRHGKEMELGDSDAMRIVMPFEPAPYWTDESAALAESLPDRVRTYYRQKVWREIGGVRYWRRVWLFDEHRLDEAGMQRLADAVVQQWLAAGTRVSP